MSEAREQLKQMNLYARQEDKALRLQHEQIQNTIFSCRKLKEQIIEK